MDFKDKVIVITGASRGIGEATARYFAFIGAHVFLAATNADRIGEIAADLEDQGASAHAVACDVSDPAQVLTLISTATDRTGRLDLLVNNAGLIDPIARLADSEPLEWGRTVDVNLKGVYHGLRYAIPVMVAQGGGTIVNISSGAATSALEGWSHYCATKAAVLSLTRVADREYRNKGLRVIGLSPGTVATRMQEQIRASGINPVSQLDWSAHIPAEWVAKAIAWLTTEGADPHLGSDFSLKSNEGRRAVGLPEA
ncbi:SDR family NAD(P)-dependent oxidoreductase [Phyllobacterium salinisoli]|uniref:SDR family NAD(P)-dependent oxidoreductase n=1 Tax=Phyllobacterium salinisoli TaxID=1899321 RepID=A0A368K058_9HYPH|nr:SDR family oxidoreductase [Phyllobacterium salinisoli]RCS22786.1 SDR family NAD(P)-dependent oxidoreductase [Phyllobacterium salinisoli]